MTNPLLKEITETVGDIIRNDFNQPVELIDLDGKLYTQSKADPTKKIMGMVMWESRDVDFATGMDTMVQRPVVSIFLDDLERVPEERFSEPTAQWVVRIPKSPLTDETRSYTLSGPPKLFNTLNYIQLKLQRLTQS